MIVRLLIAGVLVAGVLWVVRGKKEPAFTYPDIYGYEAALPRQHVRFDATPWGGQTA